MYDPPLSGRPKDTPLCFISTGRQTRMYSDLKGHYFNAFFYFLFWSFAISKINQSKIASSNRAMNPASHVEYISLQILF